MKGKNFANRKPESERPLNDFYPTPSCMVKELVESNFFPDSNDIRIFDPCCGKYAIGNVLRDYGYKRIRETDIIYGKDFLRMMNPSEPIFDVVIMNPPFKLFDKFVEKAKLFAENVYCIGKLNYFGVHSRNVNGLWNNLRYVLPFDRMIAFDKPEIDGKVECGMMVTGWFVWNKGYRSAPTIKVLDMRKYIRSKKDERNDIFKR